MRKSRFSEEQIAYAPRPLALAPACKTGTRGRFAGALPTGQPR